MLVVSALKKLGPNATAEQVRNHLANLTGFAGINGIYDFTKVAQRGLSDTSVYVTRWSSEKKTWLVVSESRGVPFK